MAGYVHVRSRRQVGLPASLDDAVSAGSLARVVDAFVASQDLRALGFARAGAADAVDVGRPSFDPSALAGLLLYGYMEGMRSSRRLEKECERNKEVCWLLGDARPCFKTIANFRRENGAALVELNRAFVVFCRGVELLGAEVVAVDGSKFQSAASDKAVYDAARIARELASVGRAATRKTAKYLAAVEAADAADEAAEASSAANAKSSGAAVAGARAEALLAELAKLSKREGRLHAMKSDMERRGVKHCVKGDAGARALRKADGSRVVGYNVQAAVDAEHKLVVHVDVTDAASDHGQLARQAKAAKEALGVEALTVVADAGYQNAAQAQACEEVGIEVALPAPQVVNPCGKQYFSRERFEYDAERDRYTCPGGEVLTLRGIDGESRVYRAEASACAACSLKAQCTAGKRRSVKRHIFAEAQERANRRAADNPGLMKLRMAVVEQSFANMKRGGGRFLLRGMEHVKVEMSLGVLAYNLRRVINIVGARTLCAMLTAPMPTPAAAPCPAPP